MKIKLFFTVALFFLCANFFAQDDSEIIQDFSAQGANRRTALSYLQLAKERALQADWKGCAAAANAGNKYDETVADLWYFMALANYNNGAKRKFVMPMLKKSLSGAEWVDYNKGNARILYADFLCSTGNPNEALKILDEDPFIYSADAEYIRIKSYYTMGGAANVKKARDMVDVARRIYPADARFPHLFFAYEYRLMYSKNYNAGVFDYMPLNKKARKIAESFIARLPEYDSEDAELEIYAAIFAEGSLKTRLLKAFDARGFRSPLFAAAALEDGVISDGDALEYFLDFMEDGVDLFELERFASVLKGENVKADFAVYLNAYSGTLYSDTNNTLESNLSVVYSRGRPQQIMFDSDNDGVDDWICECDFGVPERAHFLDKRISVDYGTYPSPVRVIFEEVPGEEGSAGSSKMIFNLADETVDAQILKILPDRFIAASGVLREFFIIDEYSLWKGDKLFDQERLIASINNLEKYSQERDGASIRFLLLDGAYYAADYFIGDKVYAHAQFSNPLIRNVDRDDDGIFETTEIYDYAKGDVVISKEDFEAAAKNIWGSSAPNSARYLRMVQIDRNNDTRPDFTEEYLTQGGRISTWDLDYDGEWDSRHTILPKGDSEKLSEVTEIFVVNAKGEKILVTIATTADEPQEIFFNKEHLVVTKGAKDGFYWVGGVGTTSQETKVLGQMKNARFGVMEQFEETDCYLQAVYIDGKIFTRALKKIKIEADAVEK